MVRPLSRERILACALELADREGLEAASLRRIANELGVHVTSLYNHVPTKDALLDGLVERLIVSAHVPVGNIAWDDWVRQFSRAMARTATDHPGSFSVFFHRPVQGARAAATFETGLASFRRAGMDVEEAYAAVKSVVLGVLGCCTEQALLRLGERSETDVTGLDWQQFPELHNASEVVYSVDLPATLEAILVAGLEQRLAQRSPRGTHRRQTSSP